VWNLRFRFVLPFGAMAMLAVAAHAANQAPSALPIDARIGWMDRCLAIKNDGLQPGTPVTLLLFADDEHLIAQRLLTRRVAGKIGARTTSAEKCPALIEDRRGGNQIGNVSFYTLSVGDVPVAAPVFGIGLVGVDPTANELDLDGNGLADSFTVCRADQGFSFAAWKDKPRLGEPLWSAGYYIGLGGAEKDCIPDPELADRSSDSDPAFTSAFAARIGWVDKCLAIENDALKPGTPVTLVMFDSDADRKAARRLLKRHASGRIVGKTSSASRCPALKGRRKEANALADVSFYTVVLDDGPADAGLFGIGIIGPESEDTDFIDLDGNGVADSFTACPSLESIHFAVWKGAPDDDRAIWDAFDYLGHEADRAECPFTDGIAQPAGPPSLWAPEFRLGWVYGVCLGIVNAVLQPGTAVTIATSAPEDEHAAGRTKLRNTVAGKIVGKVEADSDCPELATNVKELHTPHDHNVFYKVRLEDGQSLGSSALGIGVVRIGLGENPIDIDQNGAPDRFSVCGTGQGIGFFAWVGEPPGKPGWRDILWFSRPLTLRKPLKGLKRCPELQ